MRKLIPLFCAIVLSPLLAIAGEAFPEIEHGALIQAVEAEEVVVLDVNGTKSFEKGHIPGAIDYIAVKGELAKVLPEDKSTLIVAYCGSEKCGAYAKAAKAAKDLGYTNVKHYKPGIAGWKKQNAPLESS